MSRINIDSLKKIDKEINEGTSAECWVYNQVIKREGIAKVNGCMMNIDNEDLREKLSSNILNYIGIPCAKIDLATNNSGEKYLISYNVLDENQIHVEYDYLMDCYKTNSIEGFFEKMYDNICSLINISEKESESIFKRILNIHLMDIIIDQYDRKAENAKIIYDCVNNCYLPPVAYDYGTSFAKDATQRNGIFFNYSSEEVMDVLVNNYYSYIEDTINNIDELLNENVINNFMNEEEYNGFNKKHVINNIINRVDLLNTKVNQKRHNI